MLTHWIAVMDAKRAKIFSSDEMLGRFERVRAIFPEPKTEDRHHDVHRDTLEALARSVADLLRSGRLEGRYERLILVAPPSMLGLVRQHLDDDTAGVIVSSIHHDWAAIPEAELPERVRAAIPETAGMPSIPA